jgi:hypothetical protein
VRISKHRIMDRHTDIIMDRNFITGTTQNKIDGGYGIDSTITRRKNYLVTELINGIKAKSPQI